MPKAACSLVSEDLEMCIPQYQDTYLLMEEIILRWTVDNTVPTLQWYSSSTVMSLYSVGDDITELKMMMS